MFRSRRRPVIFPQAEHARLAGAIALAWGNSEFARPSLPFDAFVRGVTLHDRGYGQLDVDPIGGAMGAARWVEIQLAGAAPRGEDPVVDLLAALHVLRLIGDPRPGEEPVEAEARDRVEEWLPALREAAGVSEAEATEADRITDLCDSVAFGFCFERPGEGNVEVAPAPGAAPVAVRYELDGEGGIALSPWPLGVPELRGLILAYRAPGYPDELDPVVVPFRAATRRPAG